MMTKNKIKKILELHRKWKLGEIGGEYANLRGADLQGAYLDFSCWSLWCGTTNITIDSKISTQLVYHAICNMPESDRQDFLNDPVAYANRFHRVGEVAKIKWAEQAQKGSK